MFKVAKIGQPFLMWVSVELSAEADMSLEAQRLRAWGWVNSSPRPPMLETRVLQVETGERFNIRARKKDDFRVGERVPLARVANRLPFRRRWQVIATV